MFNYIFITYKNDSISVDYLSPDETNTYKTQIVSKIKDYGKESNVFLLENGKVLANIFYDGSSLLYPTKEIFEAIDLKIRFLRTPKTLQPIAFQLLEADELLEVDKLIHKALGRSCEGETYILSTGHVYAREDYRRHGYIFMKIEDLKLWCTEFVGSDPLEYSFAVTPIR